MHFLLDPSQERPPPRPKLYEFEPFLPDASPTESRLNTLRKSVSMLPVRDMPSSSPRFRSARPSILPNRLFDAFCSALLSLSSLPSSNPTNPHERDPVPTQLCVSIPDPPKSQALDQTLPTRRSLSLCSDDPRGEKTDKHKLILATLFDSVFVRVGRVLPQASTSTLFPYMWFFFFFVHRPKPILLILLLPNLRGSVFARRRVFSKDLLRLRPRKQNQTSLESKID